MQNAFTQPVGIIRISRPRNRIAALPAEAGMRIDGPRAAIARHGGYDVRIANAQRGQATRSLGSSAQRCVPLRVSTPAEQTLRTESVHEKHFVLVGTDIDVRAEQTRKAVEVHRPGSEILEYRVQSCIDQR